MVKLILEKAEEPEIKLPTSAGSLKKQDSSRKHLLLLYQLCQSLWLCGSQQTVENSERDRNTRAPDLPLEESVCRSGSARSWRETFHSWQRSWGRRLGIRKGGIEPRESPRIFSSIFPPKNQSLPTLLLCALTSDFTGGYPPPPSRSLCQKVNLQLQLIKFLGN